MEVATRSMVVYRQGVGVSMTFAGCVRIAQIAFVIGLILTIEVNIAHTVLSFTNKIVRGML